MKHPGHRVLFLGDLDDPWVAKIKGSMPGPVVSRDLDDAWPDFWPYPARDASVVVVHRAILSPLDESAFLALKSRPGPSAKLILIVGPHVRSSDLERWAGSVDLILPESTACQTLARHLGPPDLPPRVPTPIAVLSSLFETRRLIHDCCEALGHPATLHEQWSQVPSRGIVIWDVPLLDPRWGEILHRETSNRRVVCLMGFADRELVDQGLAHGAEACLDMPFDPADLSHVLDRLTCSHLTGPHVDEPHEVPPAPRIGRPSRVPLAVRRFDS